MLKEANQLLTEFLPEPELILNPDILLLQVSNRHGHGILLMNMPDLNIQNVGQEKPDIGY